MIRRPIAPWANTLTMKAVTECEENICNKKAWYSFISISFSIYPFIHPSLSIPFSLCLSIPFSLSVCLSLPSHFPCLSLCLSPFFFPFLSSSPSLFLPFSLLVCLSIFPFFSLFLPFFLPPTLYLSHFLYISLSQTKNPTKPAQQPTNISTSRN